MRHLVLLLVLALVVVPPCSASTITLPQRWHIHVINGLSNAALLVHCKSKDDDLGPQNLAGGADFTWTFDINFTGTTLFWCNLLKPGASVSFESFWVEKEHVWLSYRCADGICFWTAKDNGIYLKNIPENVDELIHKWVAPTN